MHAISTFPENIGHKGEYAFQVKHCNNLECCPGDELKENLYWLPSPIPDDENPGLYTKLDNVLGNDPTDEWVPSIRFGPPKFNEKEQGWPSNVLVEQNIRQIVKCSSCYRYRGVYAS